MCKGRRCFIFHEGCIEGYMIPDTAMKGYF